MDTEPTSLQDFAGNFLTIVDQRNDWLWYDFRAGYPTYTFDTENLDAFFEDNIIPNQKYYYLFKIRLKSFDFECLGQSEQAAGSVWE